MSLGRGLAGFAAGFLGSVGEAAQREDKARDELTKDAYLQAMSQREKAMALAKERTEERKKADEFIKNYNGTVVDGYTMSRAEAFKLYQVTNGDHTKVKTAIEDGLVEVRGVGELKETDGATEWSSSTAVGKPTADEETNMLFGSRTEAVNKALKGRLGEQEDVKSAGGYEAVGVGGSIKTIDTEEKDMFKKPNFGTFTWVDEKGESQSSQGIYDFATGKRKIWDTNKGTYVDAPANSRFDKASTTTQQAMSMTEALKVASGLIKKEELTAMTEQVNAAKGYDMLKRSLEEIAPIAMDPNNYSLVSSFVGSFSTAVEREVAGVKFILSGEGSTTKKDAEYWDAKMSTLDSAIESMSDVFDKSQDVSVKRELMEAMVLRLAIADVVASGDTRPSDMDIKLRMDTYRASKPEAFLLKAKQNLNVARNKYEAAAVSLKEVGGGAKVMQNALDNAPETLTPVERIAYELTIGAYRDIDNFDMSEPAFLKEYGLDGEVETSKDSETAPEIDTSGYTYDADSGMFVGPDGAKYTRKTLAAKVGGDKAIEIMKRVK